MSEETEVKLSEHDKELIEEGQQLVQRMDTAQLKVGRLALQFAPMGERGLKTGMGARADIFAERVGLLTSTLRVYRSVAHAWSVVEVGEDEFSFAVLQTLAAVGDKENLLRLLRSTEPPSGRARWTAQEALDFAKERRFLPSRNQGVAPEEREAVAAAADGVGQRERTVASGTWKPGSGRLNGPGDVSRETNLKYVGEQLRKSSFNNLSAAERETLDPLLAKVEAEAARLRKELTQLTAAPAPPARKQRAVARR